MLLVSSRQICPSAWKHIVLWRKTSCKSGRFRSLVRMRFEDALFHSSTSFLAPCHQIVVSLYSRSCKPRREFSPLIFPISSYTATLLINSSTVTRIFFCIAQSSLTDSGFRIGESGELLFRHLNSSNSSWADPCRCRWFPRFSSHTLFRVGGFRGSLVGRQLYNVITVVRGKNEERIASMGRSVYVWRI